MLKVTDITINNLRTGKLRLQLPEFYRLKKVIEINIVHDNQTVFNHTIAVLKNLNRIVNDKKASLYLKQTIDGKTKRQLLFVAGVFHDIGKNKSCVLVGGKTDCPEHEYLSYIALKKTLRFLRGFQSEGFDINSPRYGFAMFRT